MELSSDAHEIITHYVLYLEFSLRSASQLGGKLSTSISIADNVHYQQSMMLSQALINHDIMFQSMVGLSVLVIRPLGMP